MKKLALTTILSFGFLIGLTMVNGNAADEPDKAVVEVINAQADEIAKGKQSDEELLKAAAKIAESKAVNGKLGPVMALLKKRDQGGVGVGSVPGKVSPDGVEAILINMRRRIPPVALGENQKDVIRALEQTAAIGAVAYHLPNEKAKKDEKTLKEWQQFSLSMVTNAKDLATLLKACNDPDTEKAATAKADAKKAARALNTSCADCHTTFDVGAK